MVDYRFGKRKGFVVSGFAGYRIARTVLLTALCLAAAAARAEWIVGQSGGCVLETGETSIFDGYQDTRLKLSLTNDGLLIRTKSNIDPGFEDLGLAVDGGEFIPADTVVDEQHVLFSGDSSTITGQFVRGRSVKVYLRFWPTYPATRRYEANFSLIGFTRAYNDYKKCRDKSPA